MKVKKISEAVDWKRTMEHNNENIDRLARLRTQVNIDPVMEEVIDETEKADKNAKEVFTKLAKDADSITPKDPDIGKKVTIKPYTEKLTLDEGLFKESWTSFGGSWRNQTVKKVNYEEDDISDIAEELMNWYGECFEGWEAADIKDALYGLDGERIPGSDCPIIFTMEEDEDNEDDEEEYDESLSKKSLKEDYNVREYSDMLYDMIENDEIDAKTIAEDLIYWCSEDDIERYMKINELIWEDEEDEDEDDMEESLKEVEELKEERLSRFDAYKYIEEFLYNILLNPNKEDYLEYEFYKKFINSFNKGKDPSNDSSVLESIYDVLEWLYDIEKIDLDDFNKFAIVDIIKKIIKKYKKRKNNLFIKEAKAKQPKYWNSMFTTKVIDAYKNGKLTLDNIDEWEKEYNGGTKPSNLGTREILTYHMNTGKDPRNESLEKKSLGEDWVLEPGKTFRSKSDNEITIKEVIPYVSEYDGTSSLRIKYNYVLNNGKFGSSECSAKDLFNMLNENVNLLEYASEDEEETVFDFVEDRLFGEPTRRNASNYRATNSFCKDIWIPLVGGKGRFREVYHYPSGIEHLAGDYEDENRRAPMADSGFAINLKSEDEANLAKAVADELNFTFTMTPINNSKYKFLAKILIPESIYEMPIADYLESIGKSIKDYRKRNKRKSKED